jgi:CheY-like chemotaxis protein
LNTKIALQHLKRMGYTADHAKDGLEVLSFCEKAALANSLYDVILLDIQMPNMDVSPLFASLIAGLRSGKDSSTAIRKSRLSYVGCVNGERNEFR